MYILKYFKPILDCGNKINFAAGSKSEYDNFTQQHLYIDLIYTIPIKDKFLVFDQDKILGLCLLPQNMRYNVQVFSSVYSMICQVVAPKRLHSNNAICCPFPPGSNAEVVYSIAESANGQFSIEEATGVIRLEKPLKEAQVSTLELTVCAMDKGFPYSLSSFATVTVSVVDLKEYLPVFLDSEYVVVVQEDVAVGTQVLNLSSLMRDGVQDAEIVYEIVNGNERGKFRLHPHTGQWTVCRAIRILRFESLFCSWSRVEEKSEI